MGLFDKIFGNVKAEEDVLEQPINENVNGPFHLVVEDVFTIVGRGTVVTGHVDSGTVRVGDVVTINGIINTEVIGVEMFRKSLDYAQAGDNCGLVLKDITAAEVIRGYEITK